MQIINPTISTQLAAGATDVRGLIRFDFGAGTYGFCRSAVPIDYGGLTYLPHNLIEVSGLSFAIGTSAQEFTVKLAMSGDDETVSDQLKQIYALDYKKRPVTVMDAHYNIATGAFIGVVVQCKGNIVAMPQKKSPQMGVYLEAECMSEELSYSKRNGRLASDKDQNRRFPGDRILEHASKVGITRTPWGQEQDAK